LLKESGKEEGEKVKERIVIPAEDGNGLNAKLSEHFGRAQYFIVVDLMKMATFQTCKPFPT
jgi:hypothetical protein